MRQRQDLTDPIPPFCSGPATSVGNFLSESGANALARTIKAAWAVCGWDVETRVERVALKGDGLYAVRTDLLNGLPRRRLAAPNRRAA